ncbi:hexameric tyrosine-coordinated heme protein [uncultured Paracoccus sp.]|uniref:hexameric tyrosine-coordinated heme protein n=1 Tax=uncultured Paracoccus sp. TaxID=189685 RepID=UPI002612652D|nr:hexameric tyrosine-coordinated heme protein [uncultured Paracoccus sp.]
MFRRNSILALALIVMPAAGFAQTAGEMPDAGMADTGMAAPTGQAAETATQEVWLETLQTETPQQGFELAITLARRAVKTTQSDTAMLKELRPVYAADANSLIDVSGVAAHWFGTVAAANDYWRD